MKQIFQLLSVIFKVFVNECLKCLKIMKLGIFQLLKFIIQ
jgi:hypothetical protein